MTKIYDQISRLAKKQGYLVLLLSIAISVFTLVKGLISANNYYAQSKYPPRIFEGQLAFSSSKIKSWFQVLIENDTLDLYIKTQYLDFIFIIGLMATIFFTQLLIVKLNPLDSKWFTFAVKMSFWGPLLATADIWENIATLVMAHNPLEFSNALAYLASSFTVWKLLWATIGTSLIVVQFISLGLRKLKLKT